MVFFILAAASVLLAVVRVQSMRVGDPRTIKRALLRGATTYFALWVLGTGVFGPASRMAPPLDPELWANVLFVIEAILAVVLWTSLAELAFYRFRKRDLIWILPFGTLSILFGVSPGVNELFASLWALPALSRIRWKREISGGTLTVTALLGFLVVLFYFWSPVVAGNPEPSAGPVLEIASFAFWIRSLALVYAIVALPRLAWGLDIQIPSVRWRLLVSHLLAGLVPVVLVFLFWALSTYLSVNADRAQVAARHLREEAYELGRHLESGIASDAEAEARLRAWAEVEDDLRPGTRVYLSALHAPDATAPDATALVQPPSAESRADSLDSKVARLLSTEGATADAALPSSWSRILGPPLSGEGAVAALPDTFSHGVVLLDGEPFLCARRVSPSGERAGAVLVPAAGVLGDEFFRRLDAHATLDTGRRVRSSGLVVELAEDSLSGSSPSSRTSGAAVVTVHEWMGDAWRVGIVPLWTQVGFFEAVRGLTRNLQENPFKLIPLLFLAMVAFLFVLVEVLTLGMVISMGRSITRALGALAQGTARLREGNLRYRIPIEGRDDLWEVADSFNRMAINLEEARDTEIEKERLEGELAIARQIQARLLPADAPHVPRTELAGLSLPAREIGGDYYDFVPMPGGKVGLIVADVSGKGVPAALLMSSFRASLLAQDLNDTPSEILGRLNAFLHRSVEPGRFVTAFFGVLDPDTGHFVYSNAGHNPPYRISAAGEVSTLCEGGLVLGLFAETTYDHAAIHLAAGDTIALFTDGVTEAQNPDEEMWGEDRFLHVVLRHVQSPCRRIVSEVLRELRGFAGEEVQSDDITLLLARWKGAPVEAAAEAALSGEAAVRGSAALPGASPLAGRTSHSD